MSSSHYQPSIYHKQIGGKRSLEREVEELSSFSVSLRQLELSHRIMNSYTLHPDKYIGAHVSAMGGVELAPLRAGELGARAFALFLKNQRQWQAKPYTQEQIDSFIAHCAQVDIDRRHVLPHASYLYNIGNADPDKRLKSRLAMIDEVRRCQQLGLGLLNFHPGSHLNEISEEQCLQYIASEMNAILAETDEVKLVLENVAGQGTNVGYSFEQLAYIISLVDDTHRVGVCIDTAHTLAAGYEIRTPDGYNATWQAFDDLIGYDKLSGIHLNDSKKDLGSRVDRHESIGQGFMGNELFKLIMHDPHLDNIPIILETPVEGLWAQEIAHLYSL